MHSIQENKTEQLLSIEDLSVEFISGENVQRAVNNISFTINKGETLALVGESTTLPAGPSPKWKNLLSRQRLTQRRT